MVDRRMSATARVVVTIERISTGSEVRAEESRGATSQWCLLRSHFTIPSCNTYPNCKITILCFQNLFLYMKLHIDLYSNIKFHSSYGSSRGWMIEVPDFGFWVVISSTSDSSWSYLNKYQLGVRVIHRVIKWANSGYRQKKTFFFFNRVMSII